MPVAVLYKQFGPTTGGAGSPPDAPTVTVVDDQDGTQTATISASTALSTNAVYAMVTGGAWVQAGVRVGDGTVDLALANGRYFIYVRSTINSQFNVSQIAVLWVNDGTGDGNFDHSPAAVLRQLLIDIGMGTSQGAWPIKVDNEPDAPDDCITVYNTSGGIDGRDQISGEGLEHPGVQVRVRSANPADGWEKAKAIAVALDRSIRLDSVTIDAATYIVHAVTRTGSPLSLGSDVSSTKRRLFTVNAKMALRQLT